ncbi:MAG: hypothetical protein H6R18_2596 [Proteobacteria bacterium]|nr:hypothetical protein [Pseudomonadota bacterium]
MESFHWDQSFVTGLPEVDKQHHRLVELINRFGDLVTAGKSLNLEDLETVLEELKNYTVYHFREEESLMNRIGVDTRHVSRHLDIHCHFLQEITRLRSGITPENQESAASLLDYLSKWLAYHILGTDQNLARQIAAIEAGKTPADAYLAQESKNSEATEPLLNALTGLFRRVSERNRELIELNTTLEKRVAERTEALLKANEQLEFIAMTDQLTGLPNRRHALKSLNHYWIESLRENTPLVCMMIDADGFKEINDKHGHDAGDEVLRQLAGCLKNAVRTDDMICRLGGDEFLLICPNTPLAGGMQLAEKMRSEVAAMRVPAGNSGIWRGSISVGVSVRSETIQSTDELIKIADSGVYLAKQRGRNCVATVCTTADTTQSHTG